MAPSQTFDIFVGTETGFLKGVNTSHKYFKNLNSLDSLDKQREIITMIWNDSNETEIIFGLKNRLISTFNVETLASHDVFSVEGGDGPLRGIAKLNDRYVTCVESGLVKVWKTSDEQDEVEFMVGNNVYKMKQNPQCPSVIATGGKENDLKLWDLQETKVPIFKAKNVARDFLDLRVPIWVTDFQFVPDSKKIVVCTGHHHIRLYDPSTPQKRPVISMEFDEYPLTAISIAKNENLVIVGNSHGRMALFDLRKKLLVHSFKGFAGSIRSIHCHPTEPLVASCGLDRFLRIHHVHKHELMHKVYLKSRLNCLLFYDKAKCDISTDVDVLPIEDNKFILERAVEDDQDDIWTKMPQASDEENDDGMVKKTSRIRKRKLMTKMKQIHGEEEVTDSHLRGISIKKRDGKKQKLKRRLN